MKLNKNYRLFNNSNFSIIIFKKDTPMEEKIFLARVAEQAERFDDMVTFLEEAIKAKSDAEDFTVDERNLLSVGFKNQIGS